MTQFANIIGRRFNRLLVCSRAANDKSGQSHWKCLCDCGATATIRGSNLKNETTQSCGCLQKERTSTAALRRIGKPAPWKHRPYRFENGVYLWRCGTCREFFSAELFHRNSRTLLGLTSSCKTCHNRQTLKSRSRRDPAVVRANGRRFAAARRARIVGAGGSVTVADIGRLETILGCLCLRCRSGVAVQQDHILPISKGGLHHPLNLQPLCRTCNEKKQASVIDYRTDAQIKAVRRAFKRVVNVDKTGTEPGNA